MFEDPSLLCVTVPPFTALPENGPVAWLCAAPGSVATKRATAENAGSSAKRIDR